MEKKMIEITSRCKRCGKSNKYKPENWKGREETLCKHCGKILTICSGYIYDLMDEKEFKKFMRICGV